MSHDTILKVLLVVFFICTTALVAAGIYVIPDKVTPPDKILDDGLLEVLNRVPGVEGPALYPDERLRTSLKACNKSKDVISVRSEGVFRQESPDTNVVVVIDPSIMTREAGCNNIIRMSAGTVAERGLTSGIWHIEGGRSVIKDGKTLQTFTFKSQSFKVVPR